jgi:WD40 repeat protein
MKRQLAWAAVAVAMVTGTAVGGGSVAAWSAPSSSSGPAARAATGPGTIVFVKDHNVWIARGDGSSQTQVTKDGDATTPYVSPSQSVTGVIAAGHGPHIYVMRQNGTVLNRMDPPPLTDEASHPLDGPPVQVAISPDGSLVAYTFYSYGCAIGTPCSAYTATGITRTDSLTPASTYGQTYDWAPSWVGNQRTIQSGGYLHQIEFKDLGAEPVHWFDDKDVAKVGYGESTDLEDAELSADGRWLAAVRGYNERTTIAWYSVSGEARTGAPPAVPTWLCVTSPLAGLASPTFSPDSKTLAWQEPDGVWSTTLDASSCPNPELLIPGAGQPDWSAAELNLRPTPSAGFTMKQRPQVHGKARPGKKLVATAGRWSPKPAKATFRWLRNGKPIPRATSRTYRVKATDRGRRIAVRVTVKGSGSQTSATSKAVVVRR